MCHNDARGWVVITYDVLNSEKLSNFKVHNCHELSMNCVLVSSLMKKNHLKFTKVVKTIAKLISY